MEHCGCSSTWMVVQWFRRFVIRNIVEVESGNSGIHLLSYTYMRITRQLDGALLGPRTVFKEECFGFDVLYFSQCVFISN